MKRKMPTTQTIVETYFEGDTPEGRKRAEKKFKLSRGQATNICRTLDKYLKRKIVPYPRKNYEDAAALIRSHQENLIPSLEETMIGEVSPWSQLEVALEGVKIAVQKVLESELLATEKENQELKKQLAELNVFKEEAKKDNWIKSLQNKFKGNR